MKIVLEKGQRLFFTSDTHYGHSNICRATTRWKDSEDITRDFKSLDHMNDVIVDNINNTVGENDILIHLGDWSFGGIEKVSEFRDRLVCKNIHITLGNHDHHIRDKEILKYMFSSVQQYLHLDIRRPAGKNMMEKFTFVCMHYPIASWDGMNDQVMHLHGHCHLPPHHRVAQGRAMDVGMDGAGMEVLSLDEVLNILKDRPVAKLVLPSDHHEKRRENI
jgi:calcineurin-like phosphoesterase family protein